MDENEQIPYQIDFAEGRIVSGRWKVVHKLGTGAYGVVYSVQDIQKPGMLAALKVELNQENEMSMLKIEKEVLQLLQERSNTIRLMASGKRTDYSFIVITLCGYDLQRLKQEKKITFFTESTMFRIGIHALYAIKQLHEIGYIHRDIKPQNFVLGASEKDNRMLYLIDYGMVRQYAIPNENPDEPRPKNAPRTWIIRRARKKVLLRGTMRYCSVNVHKRQEQGRVDDIYSLFYMLIEMRMPLPWSQAQREERLMAMKENFPADIHVNKIEGMRDILTYLSGVRYADRPDYKFIYNCLMEVIRKRNYKFSDGYDWEDVQQVKRSEKESRKQLQNQNLRENFDNREITQMSEKATGIAKESSTRKTSSSPKKRGNSPSDKPTKRESKKELKRKMIKGIEKSAYQEYSKYKTPSTNSTNTGGKSDINNGEMIYDEKYPTTLPNCFDFKLGDVPSGESGKHREGNHLNMTTSVYMQ